MSAKGRKRMQRKKAKNRTGLIKSLTSPYSYNQQEKNRKRESEYSKFYTELSNKIFNS